MQFFKINKNNTTNPYQSLFCLICNQRPTMRQKWLRNKERDKCSKKIKIIKSILKMNRFNNKKLIIINYLYASFLNTYFLFSPFQLSCAIYLHLKRFSTWLWRTEKLFYLFSYSLLYKLFCICEGNHFLRHSGGKFFLTSLLTTNAISMIAFMLYFYNVLENKKSWRWNIFSNLLMY